MKNEIFSGIDKIPTGTASHKITEGCIVIEGGGFRGVYSEGVLDALMKADINMGCTVGVSAGALNGLNYVSGQIGRTARINLRFRHDDRYVGMQAMKRDNGIIGFSYLFKDIDEFEPFNYERFYESPQRFVAVATNLITGKAEYFEKNEYGYIFQAVRASASLPYISKPVNINNVPYLDGGCACKLPYQWALDNQFKKIIVVKNRPSEYRADVFKNINRKIERSYRNYPQLAKVLAEGDERYNKQCDELECLEQNGRVFIISPSKNIKIDTLEKDVEKLGEWYFLGCNDTKKKLPELISYLNAEG